MAVRVYRIKRKKWSQEERKFGNFSMTTIISYNCDSSYESDTNESLDY